MPKDSILPGDQALLLDTPNHTFVIPLDRIAIVKAREEGGTRITTLEGKHYLMSCPIEDVKEAIEEASHDY
jgi:hypothetical protein